MGSAVIDETQFEALESLARKFLDGEPADLEGSIICEEPGSPVACLLAMSGTTARKLMPLFAGRTVVGRGAGTSYPSCRQGLTGIVEGAQWVINATPSGTTAADAGSSNGSLLVPRRMRSSLVLDFVRLRQVPDLTYLGWDGSNRNVGSADIATGDLLVNPYAWFLFVR
jgi:hypothetical protein